MRKHTCWLHTDRLFSSQTATSEGFSGTAHLGNFMVANDGFQLSFQFCLALTKLSLGVLCWREVECVAYRKALEWFSQSEAAFIGQIMEAVETHKNRWH